MIKAKKEVEILRKEAQERWSKKLDELLRFKPDSDAMVSYSYEANCIYVGQKIKEKALKSGQFHFYDAKLESMKRITKQVSIFDPKLKKYIQVEEIIQGRVLEFRIIGWLIEGYLKLDDSNDSISNPYKQVRGKLTGIGRQIFPDGGAYVGHFKEGLQDGYGTYAWQNGDIYRGQWSKGEFHGYGEITFSDGTTYRGHFEHDKYHGYGVQIYPNGYKYTGQWYEGFRHGYGKEIRRNGRQYVGQWEYGRKHGEGTFIDKHGNAKRGLWDNNKLIKWF